MAHLHLPLTVWGDLAIMDLSRGGDPRRAERDGAERRGQVTLQYTIQLQVLSKGKSIFSKGGRVL